MKIKALRTFKDKGAKPSVFSFGKVYDVSDSKGKLYIGNGWVEEAKKKDAAKDGNPELEALKVAYKEKAGKKPHHSWDVEALKEKIKELENE